MTGLQGLDGAGRLFSDIYRNRYFHKTRELEDYSPNQIRLLRYWAVYLMKCWMTSPEFRKSKDVRKITKAIEEQIPEFLTEVDVHLPVMLGRIWQDFEMGTYRRSLRARNLKNQEHSYSGLCDLFDVDMQGVIDQLVREQPDLGDPRNLLNKSQAIVAVEYEMPPRVVKAIFRQLTESGEYEIKPVKSKETKKAIKALIRRVSFNENNQEGLK